MFFCKSLCIRNCTVFRVADRSAPHEWSNRTVIITIGRGNATYGHLFKGSLDIVPRTSAFTITIRESINWRDCFLLLAGTFLASNAASNFSGIGA